MSTWISRITLGLLCLATLSTPGTAQQRIVQYRDVPGAAMIYGNGYLLSWDNPVFSRTVLYGRDAAAVYSVLEHKDGIYHSGWAVDSDGLAAAVYEVRKRWEGRIDLFASNGARALTIGTGAYVPEYVVFAPDHTLWTAGYIAGNDGTAGDFNVLHHYSRDGKTLGQALPWSEIKADRNSYTALQALIGGSRLYVSRDRLGFNCHCHDSYSTWIEVSFSGGVLGQYDLRDHDQTGYFPVAMTRSGQVYARIYDDTDLLGWAVLDHSERAWHQLARVPPGRIIGSDMDNVVFADRDADITIVNLVRSDSFALSKPVREEEHVVGGSKLASIH